MKSLASSLVAEKYSSSKLKNKISYHIVTKFPIAHDEGYCKGNELMHYGTSHLGPVYTISVSTNADTPN